MKLSLVALLLWSCSAMRSDVVLLDEANALYDAGQRVAAKEVYTSAAKDGNIEAHYLLTYRYILPPSEELFHLEVAAKAGHEKALESLLEALMFVDPQKGLDLYYETKSEHPTISFYDDEYTVELLGYLAEIPQRDLIGFLNEHGINQEELTQSNYGYWKLAEEASRVDSRFGQPTPERTLWLISQGGGSPFAFGDAVGTFYKHWKNGQVVPFDLCDFVSSGAGASFCMHRETVVAEENRVAALSALGKGLSEDNQALLQNAYTAMNEFLELKVDAEEMHGGTGAYAWSLESSNQQKDAYLTFLRDALNGKIEGEIASLTKVSAELEQTYASTLETIAPIDLRYIPKPDGVKAVHDSWKKHQTVTCQFIAQLQPKLQESCFVYLAKQRIEQLKIVADVD